MFCFKPKFKLNLIKTEIDTQYTDAEGFFEFKGDIFFKYKGQSGRLVSDTSVTFTSFIKEKYPEFSELRPSEVGKLTVSLLKVK